METGRITLLFFVSILYCGTLYTGVQCKYVHDDNRFASKSTDDYLKKRQNILYTEQQERLGGEIVLTADEIKANNILMRLKDSEIDQSFVNGAPFPPQLNFLVSKPLVQESKVFQLIRMMPKGGALHLHDCSITDVWWLVRNATYRNNCYMCYDDKKIQFHFYKTLPSKPLCDWKLVSTFRQQSGNSKDFDQMLYESMILTNKTISEDINVVWKRFEEILVRANGLINYAPVFQDYLYEGLTEFQQDNVQYIEIRALMAGVYSYMGEYNTEEIMKMYQTTIQRFVTENTNFTGARIIKSNIRVKLNADIKTDVIESMSLLQKFPGYFVGYDLVGQEDVGKPLLYYLDALLYPSQQNPPVNLPYFFHAGETDWQGTKVDDNLVDAILLNTSRIGHGYALTKHPEVLKVLKPRGIAVEVNPISNQVLKLVDDLRNHPATFLIDQGYPVVISSDDPAVWGASGLSYDFYMTFMGMTGRDDDIRVLKQLAMNSLLFSAMSPMDKVKALDLWENKWNDFISKVIGNKHM